jgi:hypothetical protein
MNENIKWFAAALAVVGLTVGGIIWLSRGDKAAPVETPLAAVPEEPAAAAPAPEEPAVKYPLPEPVPEKPLPPLDESDVPVLGALTDLIGKDSVERFIVSTDLVRHIVVSVDNLTTEKVVERIRPWKPAPGSFAVTGSEEEPVLDASNYQRYLGAVAAIRALDTQRLVATYTRHYPLFQEAYESLGHPPEYFNDRLIEVIDHLLAAPEVPGPIALARPNVQYEFADPSLEARSAGQKALIRMGTENAKVVKAKLRELRSELVARKPAGQDASKAEPPVEPN